MVELNNFSMNIESKNSQNNGQVLMEHEEQYSIVLRNGNSKRADIELFVDGESVGTWRANPRQTLVLERPAEIQRKFTFVKKEQL